ncbi:hypothetical protein AMS68_000032 [Peltaster fructicola]|uniref:DUF159 domain protein n=1 Tax=Peltaster fructicola TaxID=286661 RepID=A0A6H0XIR4_9PEZI|nr:hypothetical protein AMS68_000032 [Peltaster fructicola]
MCGRYALSLRPSMVRQRLADQDMYADEAPPDDDHRIRQTYNFAPGYHGLIYRASGPNNDDHDHHNDAPGDDDGEPARKRVKVTDTATQLIVDGRATKETKYKLQAAKWGLIPFWTKRAPDYGSQMRTINCRDDSLIENRGMWNTMKQRKRCIVVAEGFYEWLKKNNGKEKIPHFMKRKDGELMCFAGLWDMVQYEGSEEKLYTYTIITTDSNKQLKFLHDRMPVIMEPGSEGMKMWLDPSNIGWSKELQHLLKPYDGELECYPVDKGVGKVGNNSPSFVIPVDSKDNKKNIANFFDNQVKKAEELQEVKHKDEAEGRNIKQEDDHDSRATTNKVERTEDNAPLPVPKDVTDAKLQDALNEDDTKVEDVEQSIKQEVDSIDDQALLSSTKLSPTADKSAQHTPSPAKKSSGKPQTQSSVRKARNATSNMTQAKTPSKESNAKITSFFGK